MYMSVNTRHTLNVFYRYYRITNCLTLKIRKRRYELINLNIHIHKKNNISKVTTQLTLLLENIIRISNIYIYNIYIYRIRISNIFIQLKNGYFTGQKTLILTFVFSLMQYSDTYTTSSG